MTPVPPLTLALLTALAYLIGGLPFGYLFVRYSLGKDVRTIGSGNIGATNVHRAAGGKAGLVVLFLDMLKGFLAVWLAARFTDGDAVAIALALLAVMVGHCYPFLLGFKGGKAVACFIGAFLYLGPLAILVTAVLYLLIVAGSKYVSLASIIGALVFPFVLWLIYHPTQPVLMGSVLAGLLIIYRHQANISRLLGGTETAFSLKGGSAR